MDQRVTVAGNERKGLRCEGNQMTRDAPGSKSRRAEGTPAPRRLGPWQPEQMSPAVRRKGFLFLCVFFSQFPGEIGRRSRQAQSECSFQCCVLFFFFNEEKHRSDFRALFTVSGPSWSLPPLGIVNNLIKSGVFLSLTDVDTRLFVVGESLNIKDSGIHI